MSEDTVRRPAWGGPGPHPGHKRVRCCCGQIIAECRCVGPKVEEIVRPCQHGLTEDPRLAGVTIIKPDDEQEPVQVEATLETTTTWPHPAELIVQLGELQIRLREAVYHTTDASPARPRLLGAMDLINRAIAALAHELEEAE